MEDARPVSIRRPGPDTLALFLRFFDGDAFADNSRGSSCYCQCFRENHDVVTWSERTAAQDRARACSRTQAAEMQGCLALDGDDQPVGFTQHCEDTDGSVYVRRDPPCLPTPRP